MRGLSVCLSVCVLVTLKCHAKTTELIKMSFGNALVSSRNNVSHVQVQVSERYPVNATE